MARLSKPKSSSSDTKASAPKKDGVKSLPKPLKALDNKKSGKKSPKPALPKKTAAAKTTLRQKTEWEAREFETARIQKVAHADRPPAGERVFPGNEYLQLERASNRLPDGYGDNHIYLMIRDPFWVFTYWEIQPDHEQRTLKYLKAKREEVSTVLRVYDLDQDAEGKSYFDVPLQGMVRSWYINVQPGRRYVIEIGLLHADGRFAALARSNEIKTPRTTISEEVDEQWMSANSEKIYAASAGGLAAGAGVNGKSSEELKSLIERQFLAGVSSGSGVGLAGSGSGSASSKLPQRKRGFWFVLDCEVIVYGATEPDARVTLQGREMKLRPDGTFSARFALPDGKFVFEAKAFSADGVEERTITPTVTRDTERPAPVFLKPF